MLPPLWVATPMPLDVLPPGDGLEFETNAGDPLGISAGKEVAGLKSEYEIVVFFNRSFHASGAIVA